MTAYIPNRFCIRDESEEHFELNKNTMDISTRFVIWSWVAVHLRDSFAMKGLDDWKIHLNPDRPWTL